jgi:plastocyanin
MPPLNYVVKMSFKAATAVVVTALLCVSFTHRSSAATTNVIVGFGGDNFSPKIVSISLNDSVIWSWNAAFHSTTSGTNGTHGDDNGVPSGLWDSGVMTTTNILFTNTFTSAGTFSYYCSVHFSFGMTGEVLVASSTLPPGIAITSPSNGAVFAAPANVSIQAGVTNGSGTVTNVQFLVNNTLVTSENSGPFSAMTNNLSAGDYTLSAIATDDNGLSATNAIDISVITPATVLLMNVSRPSGTEFQFSYSADTGLNYVVQRSTDLVTWIPLITNTAASNPIVFDDLNATNSLDFYRVGRLPNP